MLRGSAPSWRTHASKVQRKEPQVARYLAGRPLGQKVMLEVARPLSRAPEAPPGLPTEGV
jgi:hypothetical protein